MQQGSSRAKRLVAFAAAAIAPAVLMATPAAADTQGEQVCWLNADTGAFACFDTYAEFVAASGVAPIATAPLGPKSKSSLTSEAVAIEPYASYYIATFYEDASYGGASVNVTSSNSTLCVGYHYYGSSMPSGWNDRVSSFKGYGTCKVKLYKDAAYGGATYGPFASSSSIGSMNDEASSYQVYATS
ncbi:peptidase inhibitor family I36 protein [Demequina sp.]|uniref:peptidase inhibitor family I36 protein n=1 Tax=Demequina sp. TaxID=2050685 RepID=UPI003D0D1ECE